MKLLGNFYRSILRNNKIRKFVKPLIYNYNIINDYQEKALFIKEYKKLYGLTVNDGTFRGLKFPFDTVIGSAFIPKLVGTYEDELHHIFDDIKRTRVYKHLIDVGAAEGFYAVGLSKYLEIDDVIAFETREESRKLIEELALYNDVQNVRIFGQCGMKNFNEVTKVKYGLIFCDCEGCELILIDTEKFNSLLYHDIIVELHDYSESGDTIMEKFRQRFDKTHEITFINCRSTKITKNSYIKELLLNKEYLLSEGRKYSIGWAFIKSKFF